MPRLRLDPLAPNGVSVAPEPVQAPVRSARSQGHGYIAKDITGMITAGSNITITGSGTTSDPYIVTSSGGSGSGQTWTVNEVIDADGIADTFTTAETYLTGTLKVYLNGLRQTPGLTYDFTEASDDSFSFNFVPDASDSIIIDYCTESGPPAEETTSNEYGTAEYDTTGVYA